MLFEKSPIFKNATVSWFNRAVFNIRFGSITLGLFTTAIPTLMTNMGQCLLLVYEEKTSLANMVINVYLTIEILRSTVSYKLN